MTFLLHIHILLNKPCYLALKYHAYINKYILHLGGAFTLVGQQLPTLPYSCTHTAHVLCYCNVWATMGKSVILKAAGNKLPTILKFP